MMLHNDVVLRRGITYTIVERGNDLSPLAAARRVVHMAEVWSGFSTSAESAHATAAGAASGSYAERVLNPDTGLECLILVGRDLEHDGRIAYIAFAEAVPARAQVVHVACALFRLLRHAIWQMIYPFILL